LDTAVTAIHLAFGLEEGLAEAITLNFSLTVSGS